MQRLAGHIGTGIRDEIAYRAGYILAGTEPVHRNAARERLALLFVERLGHVRGDEAGRDRVGGNAARGHFERERARKAFDARLDRKSTRLNSSHVAISYAAVCVTKKTD